MFNIWNFLKQIFLMTIVVPSTRFFIKVAQAGVQTRDPYASVIFFLSATRKSEPVWPDVLNEKAPKILQKSATQ